MHMNSKSIGVKTGEKLTAIATAAAASIVTTRSVVVIHFAA